jgi:hypothetical protein
MANSRPFFDFLREHRNGLTHDELSDRLQELVAAVQESSRPGTLTFVLKVSPATNHGNALLISDEIKLSKPKEERNTSIFFVSPENNLVREDPRQQKLELREITPRPFREIPA